MQIPALPNSVYISEDVASKKRIYSATKLNRPTIHSRLTCPCKVDPLTPHFYIVKLGFTPGYTIFMLPTLKKWGTYWFRLVARACVCVGGGGEGIEISS